MMGDIGAIERFQEHVNVSRETIDRLKVYEALVKKWNPAINLVSKSTIEEIWTRHFLDSAQIWALRPQGVKKWLDFGSGAGFPGLVVAVLAKAECPDMQTVLIESDTRKATFLINAAREMGVSVKVHAERVENLAPVGADVVSARAVASLSKLMEISKPHLKKDGICLFPKGQSHETELTEAQKYWTFEVQKTPSVTDSGGVILRIGGFWRV